MKIALCLKGKVGNKNKYSTGEPTIEIAKIGHNYFQKNLLHSGEIDVFMHCWDNQFKDDLIKMYNPKGYSFQKQVNFNKSYPNLTLRQFSIMSYWYSVKRCMELLDLYEKKHNFQYDCVILSRFDLALQKDIAQEIKELDMNYFYHTGPDPIHKNNKSKSICRTHCCDPNSNYFEIGDMLFCSNSNNMKKFSKAYNSLNSYGLDSNHMIAVRHLKNLNLFEKRKTFLNLYAYNFDSWKTIEDGDVPLVRWVHDVGSNKKENT